jgi:hypothetical protein
MLIGIPQMLGLIVAPGQYVRPRIRITQLASDAIDLAQHSEAFEETDPDGKPVNRATSRLYRLCWWW